MMSGARTSTGQVVETLVGNLGGRPEALAVAPDGSIYTPMPQLAKVVRITMDGLFSTVIISISLPEGGGFDSQGNYYVSAFNPGTIGKLTPDNIYTPAFATGFSGPTGIIMDTSKGFLYLANYNSNSVSKVNLSDSSTTFFTSSGLINGPDGFAFDDEGNLYLANFNNSAINKISSTGVVSHFVTFPGTGIGYITFAKGNIYVAGLSNNKIYKVTPQGDTSTVAGTGQTGYLDGPALSAQFNRPNGIAASITGDTIFIGDTFNQKIRMLILSGVGINTINSSIPERFSLRQNYPNPFNPSTEIVFSIPVKSNVSLKIYNTNGQEMKTLVEETVRPGNYKVTYTSEGLPSGVYFYSLKADGYSETKKMILVK